MKNITTLGTCRIDGINGNNNLNNIITYVHSTKEIIQFILFLKGEINIIPPHNKYCFRTGIIENININYNNNFTKLFNETDIFIIEICSRKLYKHNNYYLHHLCVDKRFEYWNRNTISEIANNFKVEIQSDEEIINDILKIKDLLNNKKLLIVTHYNSIDTNGNIIKSRNELINLIEDTCIKNNIGYLNPITITKNYNQNEIMSEDLGHYTNYGKNIILNYLNDYINHI